jgi:hypothetical protein
VRVDLDLPHDLIAAKSSTQWHLYVALCAPNAYSVGHGVDLSESALLLVVNTCLRPVNLIQLRAIECILDLREEDITVGCCSGTAWAGASQREARFFQQGRTRVEKLVVEKGRANRPIICGRDR